MTSTCKNCGSILLVGQEDLEKAEARIKELEDIIEFAAGRASRATRAYYVGRTQHAESRATELEDMLRGVADDDAIQAFESVKKIRAALGKKP